MRAAIAKADRCAIVDIKSDIGICGEFTAIRQDGACRVDLDKMIICVQIDRSGSASKRGVDSAFNLHDGQAVIDGVVGCQGYAARFGGDRRSTIHQNIVAGCGVQSVEDVRAVKFNVSGRTQENRAGNRGCCRVNAVNGEVCRGAANFKRCCPDIGNLGLRENQTAMVGAKGDIARAVARNRDCIGCIDQSRRA